MAQARLNMHIDYNRFLDHEGNTILLIDYEIPYRSLLFLAHSGAFFAQVDCEVQVANQDSVIYAHQVTDNIGISSRHDAGSNIKSYLNRISFMMSEDHYQITFTAKDRNSENSFVWSFPVEALLAGSRISDLEINSRVYADSSAYLGKFRRQDRVYEPAVSAILRRQYHEHAHLYMEIYTPEEEIGESQLLVLSLEKDGDLILDEYLDFTPAKTHDSFSLKIPLNDLPAGKYQGWVSLQAREDQIYRDFEFVLSEEIETQLSIFNNPDEEYQLMRYFMASRLPANWDDLDIDTKRRHISNFWRNMSLTTRMTETDIMDLIHDRVEHANRFYSHLRPGWTTDMGRIYIRNGAPADIEKGTSSDESRFVRKDYQIWKYRSGNRPVYVFMDIQMNNNYRLIYVSGDDTEISNPDWLRYMGRDFDESLLRN
jgi:GWxTD domain-containing protein